MAEFRTLPKAQVHITLFALFSLFLVHNNLDNSQEDGNGQWPLKLTSRYVTCF